MWRLCSAKYGATAFSGEGAELYGGRWSPTGIAVAYSSESRALAVVEILANAEERDRLRAREWVFVSAEVPLELIEKPAKVPPSWRVFPHSNETQLFGTEWAKAKRSAVLRVPSAVVPGEFNYLLNPSHPDFAKVKIGKPQPFIFDPRLKR